MNLETFKVEPHQHLAMPNLPRKRPISRASTASVHSVSTQPTLDQSFEHASAYQAQWIHDQSSQPRDMSSASVAAAAVAVATPPQITTEDMLLASQLSAVHTPVNHPNHPNHPQVNHPIIYQQHHNLGLVPRGLPGPGDFSANHSFTDENSQMMDRDENDDDSMVVAKAQTKGTRSSANNELEMRQLFQANKQRTLVEVAVELHGNERGPNSERTRQVFAMLWINQVCTKGKGSVPRGRVYANYADRCANERITVLNPASFGKLVRVLFPGLKTRRLGVRGESKYHYVNFCLLEDKVDELPMQPAILPPAANFSTSFNSAPAAAPRQDRSAFPTPDAQQQPRAQPCSPIAPSFSVYNNPNLASLDQLQSAAGKTTQNLSFPDTENTTNLSEPLQLPKLEPFLPQGTDMDAAKSLTALYRSHCTSLIECIRYCKEKTFFHLYTSFQGTLTMPVSKLFGNPAIASWIEECDFVLYQRMMGIVSSLTLQVVPKPVLDTLRNISERLIPHIRESFQGQPHHVIRAKEAPAAIFAGLLDRALRVNLTAHAAANMLANPANREQMYLDWITMVRVRKVAECVPTRGMDDVVKLLVGALRALLEPGTGVWEIEALTVYGESGAQMQQNAQQEEERRMREQMIAEGGDGGGAQTVLDRWVNFLGSLKGKFPYATDADIVCYVQRVGTAVMRDLTISQGKSFGSWWVTKCWVDEMVAFMAEKGGFMAMKVTEKKVEAAPARLPVQQQQQQGQEGSRRGSAQQQQHVVVHAHHHQSLQEVQPERAPFPSEPAATLETHANDQSQHQPQLGSQHGHDEDAVMALAAAGDDSGIGIRTPEEEFEDGAKFGATFGAVGQLGVAGVDMGV